MTRVLSVIHYPSFGGPHNQVLRLAGPLLERGYSTLAVVPDEAGNAFDRLHAAGIDVRRVKLGRLRARLDWATQRRMLEAIAGDVPRLKRLIADEGIDLVVIHGLVNPQGAIAARLTRRPVVWQILDTRTPPALRLTLAPFLAGLASSVMTTGRGVADVHRGLPRDASRIFPFFPPVDTKLFVPDAAARASVRAGLGVRPDEVVVGCVANLTPQKNLEAFVTAAHELSARRPDVRFVVFGRPMSGQERYAAGLLDHAADLRASGRFLQRAIDGDVAPYVRTLDVFLATAGPRSEGISTTILEAMSSGVPVVSTDVGAIREALADRVEGLLVPLGDVAGLVGAVTDLIDDRESRERMGAAARERAVREFDVERCADVHVAAFHAALGRR